MDWNSALFAKEERMLKKFGLLCLLFLLVGIDIIGCDTDRIGMFHLFQPPLPEGGFFPFTLTLDPSDDTGEPHDNITRFDGEEVTLVFMADRGTFKNGDRIWLFKDDIHEVGYYTVSSVVGPPYLQADGQKTFTLDLPKRFFNEGITTFFATHHNLFVSSRNGRSNTLVVVYDEDAE
ncbi:MAG: hypothetical protein OXB96_00735 [Candidatus Kaiserbacteria bacterium]|nr:hypothetical protein [Candidatus Kaiserbacteria bacterium]